MRAGLLLMGAAITFTLLPPAVARENLLINSGFEANECQGEEPVGWEVEFWPAAAGVQCSTSAAQSGDCGAHAYTDNVALDSFAALYQTLPAAPGECWSAFAWIRKSEDGNWVEGSRACVHVEFFTAENEFILSYDIACLRSPSEEYAQFGGQAGPAPAGTAWISFYMIVFSPHLEGKTDVNFDAAELSLVPCGTATPSPTPGEPTVSPTPPTPSPTPSGTVTSTVTPTATGSASLTPSPAPSATETPEATPVTPIPERSFFLYDDWPAFPFCEFSGSNGGSSVTLNQLPADEPFRGAACLRLHFSGQEDWAAVTARPGCPAGDHPRLDLSGFLRVKFWLRGQPAGAEITVSAMDGQVSSTVSLPIQWEVKSIPLGDIPLENISDIITIRSATAPAPVTVLLDDISLEIDRPAGTPREVSIMGSAAEWDARLEVDGQRFTVRGIGYNGGHGADFDDDFSVVSDMCANTLRLWPHASANLALLDEARDHDLLVLLGYQLPVAPEFDYSNSQLRAALINAFTGWTGFFSDHPAVLGWIAGKDLLDAALGDEQLQMRAGFLNDLALAVHAEDPHHPVMSDETCLTALPYFQELAPLRLDALGISCFSDITPLADAYFAAEIEQPLIVLEYGCDSWRDRDWSAYTSRQRAQEYAARWSQLERAMGIALGGCARAFVDVTEDGHIGWGLVNDDRSWDLRPAYWAVKTRYCCSADGTTVEIAAPRVAPGDTFYCWAHLCHTSTLSGKTNLVIMLDIGTGDYWFWPDWAQYPPDFSYGRVSFTDPAVRSIEIIPDFTWPDTGDSSLEGINLWGAMLNDTLDAIVGELGVAKFDYGPANR